MMEVDFFQRLYMTRSGEVRRLWVYSLTLRKMETPIDPPPQSSPDGRKHDDNDETGFWHIPRRRTPSAIVLAVNTYVVSSRRFQNGGNK
jgi:hypothetical protein